MLDDKWTKPKLKPSPSMRIHNSWVFILPVAPRVLCTVGWELGVVDKVFPEYFWTMLDQNGHDSEPTQDKAFMSWIKGSVEVQEPLRIICKKFFDDLSRQNQKSSETRTVDPQLLLFLASFFPEIVGLKYPFAIQLGRESVCDEEAEIKRQLNDASCKLIDLIVEFKSCCRQGSMIGLLEDGSVVELSDRARVGDIIADLVPDPGDDDERHLFTVRPVTGNVNAAIEMGIVKKIEENPRLNGEVRRVRHSKFVAHQWSFFFMQGASFNRELHEKARGSPKVVFALH
jgi:hypothetical protein